MTAGLWACNHVSAIYKKAFGGFGIPLTLLFELVQNVHKLGLAVQLLLFQLL